MTIALNRANSVYLCVFAIFVLGIWAILDLGSAFLTAPRDLSGTWRLVNPPAPPDTTAAFSIDQSGRYVRFAFDRGPSVDVILTQSKSATGQTLTFQGDGWTMTGTGSSVGDNLNFTFQPPPSNPSPPSGTYQRQRIGQEGSPGVQSNLQHAPPMSSNARH